MGRTAIRDEVAEHLGCSLLEAEQIVDTMVARHSIGIAQAADGPALWKFGGGERTA